MDLFTIENLKIELGGREVLDIPSLEISDHKIVALTGPNGSGKTTLLQVLCGLLPPQAGKVLYRGQSFFDPPSANADSLRRDLGIVLQPPYLFKTSVLRNVCYGLIKRGFPRADAAAKAVEALDVVGMAEFWKRDHLELSGGEAQRVSIARALVLEPEVLLLDEPFTNVDAVSRSVIERVMLRTHQDNRTAILFTTHDMDQAFRLADRVITLYGGQVQADPMENLFHGTTKMISEEAVFDTGRIGIFIPRRGTKSVTAAIPPESILLSRSPINTSARNTLKGRITAVRERNGTIDVVVDAGETLVSRITEESYREMGLALGGEVYLAFKAEAVRLY